jgi:hypothetical protein
LDGVDAETAPAETAETGVHAAHGVPLRAGLLLRELLNSASISNS